MSQIFKKKKKHETVKPMKSRLRTDNRSIERRTMSSFKEKENSAHEHQQIHKMNNSHYA